VAEFSLEKVWIPKRESSVAVEGIETVGMGKRFVFEKSILQLRVS
jgi:hypothetical protein